MGVVPPAWLRVCLACLWIIGGLAADTADSKSATMIRQDFTIENSNFTYRFNIEIGTPPQMITVNADFGAADLIINPGVNYCYQGCDWQGFYTEFNSTSSKTLQYNDSYVSAVLSSDGSSLYGIWARDTVRFGNLGSVQANETSFVYRDSVAYVATDATENTLDNTLNIFGLGPRGLEASVQWLEADGSPGPTYNNLLNSMDGVRPAFSIWVDPVYLSRGTIIFGGIDESLYVPGSLQSVQMATPPGAYTDLQEPIYLAVPYYAFYASVRDGSMAWASNSWINGGSVAILNSRSRFSLPVSLLEEIGALLSAEWASVEGMYIVRCDLDGTFTLDLGTMSLNITVSEHLIPLNSVDRKGVPLCGLNIGEADQIYLSNLVLKDYFIAVDYVSGEIAFGTPSNGPDTGQPQKNHFFNESIAGMTATETSSDDRFVDPGFTILLTGRSSAAIPAPEFYSSQTTQFLLGSQPVPSILNPGNNTLNTTAHTGTALKNEGAAHGRPPIGRAKCLCFVVYVLVFSIYLLV